MSQIGIVYDNCNLMTVKTCCYVELHQNHISPYCVRVVIGIPRIIQRYLYSIHILFLKIPLSGTLADHLNAAVLG